jgi:hypothetical protein
MSLENEDENPCLTLHGYGNIGSRYHDDSSFVGHMAGGMNVAAMCNEGDKSVWLFDVEQTKLHHKLDC